MPDELTSGDDRLRDEFNRWAEAGHGEKMEQDHLSIAEQTLRLMELQPGERILDLGCGSGWATRRLASLVAAGPKGSGQVVGLDISDEMIRRARDQSRDCENALFIWGSAAEIPWQEDYFHKVLSIESFYYYPEPERVLAELCRVMAPGGRLFILINLYRDNPFSLRWVEQLKVPVQVRSEQEYLELLAAHAFEAVEARRIPDLSPTPEEHCSRWFGNREEWLEFKRLGALLLTAQKPRRPVLAP
jgi:ubiquinone/menaquinone biosynthesis C-methylase UbiE